MAPRRTLIALCSVASLAIVAANYFISGHHASGIGSDETIGTMPRAVASSECDSDDRTTTNEAAREPCNGVCFARSSTKKPLRLVVVERGTRRPLPGARVMVWQDPTGEHRTVRNWGSCIGPDFAEFLASHGRTLTTDSHGVVDLGQDDHNVYLAARSDELFGMTELYPSDCELRELEVSPSHSIEVIVRDADGFPCAGVGVGLSDCRDTDAFWSDITDCHGRCRVHDFETVIDGSSVHAAESVAIRLDVPATPAIEQWIDPAHPSTEPIVLVLPASGSVRVRLVDRSGRVLAVDGEVLVGVSTVSSPGNVRPFVSSSLARVALREGRAVAEHVMLNQHLWISAELGGTSEPSAEVDGPKSAGESTEVDLALDADAVLVRGRAVDVNGAPLTDCRLQCSSIIEDGTWIVDTRREGLTTGSDGRFDWTMKRALDREIPGLRRTCHLSVSGPTSDHREAALVIPREIVPEVLDLGDVTFAQGLPLVRGRVADLAGNGVRNVELQAVVLSSKDSSRRGAGDFDPMLDKVEDRSPCDVVVSASDGSFAIFGPCLDVRWAVRVHDKNSEVARILPFACGSQSKVMEITAQATGGVYGTALVDREWDGDCFGACFVAEGRENADLRWANWDRAGDRVCFRIDAPAPARGRIEFSDGIEHDPVLLAVNDVDIGAGAQSHPSELVDIDMRGKLPLHRAKTTSGAGAIELEIVDERGRPIPSGLAWFWTNKDKPDEFAWAGGHARIASEEVRRIELWSPEHCFSVMREPTRSARVVLRPEIELEIALALPPELRDPTLTRESTIWFATKGDPESPCALDCCSDVTYDRSDMAHVRVSACGSYGVDVTITRRVGPETEDDNGTRSTVITKWFDVRNVGGEQTLTFAPDHADCATAMKELGLTEE